MVRVVYVSTSESSLAVLTFADNNKLKHKLYNEYIMKTNKQTR